MRTKGVLLLGLIACWTAVCNGEDGLFTDYRTGDTLKKELREENLFLADDEATCETDADCNSRGECTGKGEEPKVCVCNPEYDGKKCEIIKACVEDDKFLKCTESGGQCELDDTKSAKCSCPDEKKLDSGLNFCKAKCSKENTCQNSGVCEEELCKCPPGTEGDLCGKVTACDTLKCEEKKATCKHDPTNDPYAVCECTDQNYKFKDNKCVAKCSSENPCQNGGVCEEELCKCPPGIEGDLCGKVTACDTLKCEEKKAICKHDPTKDPYAICECTDQKYKFVGDKCVAKCTPENPCHNGGECEDEVCKCPPGTEGDLCGKITACDTLKCENKKATCTHDPTKSPYAVCVCNDPKFKFVGEECVECDCGTDGNCSFVEGKKTCKCKPGFAEKDGKCIECACGEKGTCSFVNGNKKCNCFKGYVEDSDGLCKECDCGVNGKCDFKNGAKNCTCSLTFVFKEKDGKCQKCDCGAGGTCHFEDDTATCTCKDGFKEHDKKCIECDCGTNGDCDLNEGKKECQCYGGFAVKKVSGKEICVETCNDDCQNEGKCEGPEDGDKFCKCKPQTEGDKCEIITACKTGVYKNCENSGGECTLDGATAKCACSEPNKLDPQLKFCRTKCSKNDECKRGAKCTDELCKCPLGTEGDDCDKVTACASLKCEEKEATCTYDSTKTPNTFCVCDNEDHIFVETEKRCVEKCKKENYCQNGGQCNSQTNLCECKPKTSGDKCEKIEGCESLKCEDKKADCVYDDKKPGATCKCREKNYYFENGQCKPEWCKTGCKNADSCDYDKGVGICTCKDKDSYYDYSAESCKKIDSCLNMTCEGNQICRSGKCECLENYKKTGKTCEPMDVCAFTGVKSKCFTGAKCENGTSLGYVRCLCNSESSFYHSKSGRCIDGPCFLNVDRKLCKASCPSGMTRKDGDCKFNKEGTTCDADCGFLGWCQKFNETATICLCDPNYAELDDKSNKCVLKASAVCPTKERDGDNKCKCTGKYKQSGNGITCELKSCSDEDVQNECKRKRAPICVEDWKKDVGYKCVCSKGYWDDKDKGCIDTCSTNKAQEECSSIGQKCYIGQKLDGQTCRCPPIFTYVENKKSCELVGGNKFVIYDLPVLRKRYETVENAFDKVLLNIDVSDSMKQIYNDLEFAEILNTKEDKDVLLCDVWLQFKTNLPEKSVTTEEVGRWKKQLMEIKEELFLPPRLFLSSNHFAKVREEELTLCTPSEQQSICGSGSTCVNDTCSCSNGYKEITSTIRALGDKRIVRCEDIDECAEAKHSCADNSECVNTPGDYLCKCKPGFKKAKGEAQALDKEKCTGLCDPNPCGKGTCQLTKENTVDCTCQAGYTGSFCNRADVNLAKAGKATKVVGAVLGTLLAIVIILIIVYIVRQRKNSYSEDFTPAPRVDNAEMIERRPMRGVTNRAYQ